MVGTLYEGIVNSVTRRILGCFIVKAVPNAYLFQKGNKSYTMWSWMHCYGSCPLPGCTCYDGGAHTPRRVNKVIQAPFVQVSNCSENIFKSNSIDYRKTCFVPEIELEIAITNHDAIEHKKQCW